MTQIETASPHASHVGATPDRAVPREVPRDVPRTGAVAAYLELTKPGIVQLVTVTSAVGLLLAALSSGGVTPLGLLLTSVACLAGVVLSAAGANTLNQVMEAGRDAAMPRTSTRPVPSGRVGPAAASVFGAACSVLGVAVLALGCGTAPALVSLVTIITYLFFYTPLKPVTPAATLVGAVPGALPPMIGWTAASAGPAAGLLEPAGWSLFLIMFLWQVPHFLAIAWMYRGDYRLGGYPVLPVVDPSGERTARQTLIWTAALLPASLTPAILLGDVLSPIYVVVAVVLGMVFMRSSWRLARERTDAAARRLFFASIIYLPVLLLATVADALVTTLLL